MVFVLQRPVASKQQTNKSASKQIGKQTNKQTSKQANKQTNKHSKSVEPSKGSGAAAASTCARHRAAGTMQCRADVTSNSGHDAAYALRVPICLSCLEETQQLDVRGVRVRLRHVGQQRLLGSVAIDRDLRELQADTALQRWMRCSCCAHRVPRQLWLMHCERAGRPRLCARPPHRPRPYGQRAPARSRCARARVHSGLLLERARQVAACNMRQETDSMCERHLSCNMQRTTSTLRPCPVCGR